MRRFLISLLAASMLVPAAAHAEERGNRFMRESSESRDNSSNDPPQRPERSNRPERTVSDDRPARVERVQRVGRSNDGDARVERRERPNRFYRDQPPVQVAEPEPVREVQPVRRTNDSLVDGFRSIGRDARDGRDHDRDGRRDRDGWRRDRDGDHRWTGDWRRDRRYDWRGYRTRYGSLYRVGRYYDPYGWGYRRFSVGLSLWPSYYGSNYWLNDPWQYRLPPAYGPYRWVRYFDDALLVNVYTGTVVDVVHNFFW